MGISNQPSFDEYCFTQIPEIVSLLKRIAKVASVLHAHGWAEANAGNLSIRIGSIVKPRLKQIGIDWAESELYLVSKSGSRFRDIADEPASGLMLVKVSDIEEYFPAIAKPTSEWNCHRLIHKSDLTTSYPCILHTHPTEIIALSQTALYRDEKALNSHLAQLLPELPLYLPNGIATTNYQKPGSKELAELSCRKFGDKQALIWEGHGLLCRAESIDEALDYVEIVNKAAKLHFLVGSC
ncbi:MAG: class II aldolase/adducin family protein [Candidatus Cloacimonetes bacterium]|nr:class II aldolase/adducin family protein [Candidatus Cloacimonadota bacterium]